MIIYFFLLLLTLLGHYGNPNGNNIKMWYIINFVMAFLYVVGILQDLIGEVMSISIMIIDLLISIQNRVL